MSTLDPAPAAPAIGLIGIGAMGMAMARNLRARGHRVIARDIRPAAEDEARGAGIVVADSPRALAGQADFVAIVVVNAAQIDAVLFADDGVVHAAPRPRAVMLCSTIAPQDSIGFAERLASHGIAMIDGPISGGPARAADGTMSMMLAAPADVLEPWQAVLADLAAKRFVVSERIGDAAKAKLVNNLLAGINLVAGAEALALAEKIGLDAKTAFAIIAASSGSSWAFQDRMARVLEDDFEPRAQAHILTKDMTLATALAASVGHATPLGNAALAKFRETVARGWSELDDAAVIKTYRA
ncbi:MAG: NAD(P)-dependent oxidoreductase [Proteobacteria bacterium]|nr:NAD(P)-dependent oxidoreductase [Pseudomonadota bacterium]